MWRQRGPACHHLAMGHTICLQRKKHKRKGETGSASYWFFLWWTAVSCYLSPVKEKAPPQQVLAAPPFRENLIYVVTAFALSLQKSTTRKDSIPPPLPMPLQFNLDTTKLTKICIFSLHAGFELKLAAVKQKRSQYAIISDAELALVQGYISHRKTEICTCYYTAPEFTNVTIAFNTSCIKSMLL